MTTTATGPTTGASSTLPDPSTSGVDLESSDTADLTGPVDCTETPDEPNDRLAEAVPFAGCKFEFAGMIGAGDQDDYFVGEAADCGSIWTLEVAGEYGTLCLEFACMSESVGGCSGAEMSQAGLITCCSEADVVSIEPVCSGGEPVAEVFAHIRRESSECGPYELSVTTE